jgi:hypothetical protein
MALLALPLHAVEQSSDVQLAMLSFEEKPAVLVPMAILRDGKLIEPVIYAQSANEQVNNRFIDRHYAIRSKFEIRQAGEAKGRVQIDHFKGGCHLAYDFVVNPTAATSWDRQHTGIAMSNSVGVPHPSFQRPTNFSERTAFIDRSRHILSSRGHKLKPNDPYTIDQLIATKAGVSGNQLLVGSISFRQDNTEYWMFEILEDVAGNWWTRIAEIHPVHDLDDYKDMKEESLVDQLDIDGDGIDEIFTYSRYYEGGSFAAYGFREGVWKNIYKSKMAGCWARLLPRFP